jgi:hypothetical protein
MSEAKEPCAYCGHDKTKHCKGGVRHANYKDEIRQSPKPRVHTCRTRHCLQPMCDCVSFVKPKKG